VFDVLPREERGVRHTLDDAVRLVAYQQLGAVLGDAVTAEGAGVQTALEYVVERVRAVPDLGVALGELTASLGDRLTPEPRAVAIRRYLIEYGAVSLPIESPYKFRDVQRARSAIVTAAKGGGIEVTTRRVGDFVTGTVVEKED